MTDSPFPFHGPLAPDEVHGRDDLLDQLIWQVSHRRVTTLLGPRRYGKTSVLRRIASDLEAAGTDVIWVDLYETASMADVVERFDDGMGTASGDLKAWLADFQASVGINLGVVRAELRRRASERPDPLTILHQQLDGIVAAAKARPVTCIFDEFAGVFSVDGVAGLMRTKLQHHYRDIGLVFAGSQPTLMVKMFSDQSMPFYAQADLIRIEPFDTATVVEIVRDGFERTRRGAGSAAHLVARLAEGHPYRSMQLADEAWLTVDEGDTFDDADWPGVLKRLMARVGFPFETYFSARSSAEQLVLRLLASGESLFGVAADQLGLSSSSAYNARDLLLDSGDVAADRDGFRLVDPILAEWLRTRFP